MINNKGQMYIDDNEIVELMLANKQVKILPSNKTSFQQFESTCKKYGLDVPFKLASDRSDIHWEMPIEYINLDIEDYIHKLHPDLTAAQWMRVGEEMYEFEKRNLTDLLRFLCYFVTVLRSNNIVYGVGRGSSIASYVLYLIGVHRINSYKFNLDIKEFLK
jgi:DNA polymerase III alpha subunit